jgi:hypothetical protein
MPSGPGTLARGVRGTGTPPVRHCRSPVTGATHAGREARSAALDSPRRPRAELANPAGPQAAINRSPKPITTRCVCRHYPSCPDGTVLPKTLTFVFWAC